MPNLIRNAKRSRGKIKPSKRVAFRNSYEVSIRNPSVSGYISTGRLLPLGGRGCKFKSCYPDMEPPRSGKLYIVRVARPRSLPGKRSRSFTRIFDAAARLSSLRSLPERYVLAAEPQSVRA